MDLICAKAILKYKPRNLIKTEKILKQFSKNSKKASNMKNKEALRVAILPEIP